MPKQTTKEQENEWSAGVESAEEIESLAPKLKFGEGKFDEVSHDVEILEAVPRLVEHDDKTKKKARDGTYPKAESWVILVRTTPEGCEHSLWLPRDLTKRRNQAFLAIAKKHANDLRGVKVRISTENYEHEQYGQTRAYRFQEITGVGDE